MIDFSAVVLVISEGLRIAFSVADLSCNGGPYEPIRIISMAGVSFLLAASIIFRYSGPPDHGRAKWTAMMALAMVLNTVLLCALLVGSVLKWARDWAWPFSIVFAVVLVVLSLLALTPPFRRHIRHSMARRGYWQSLALLVAHVLVAGSILTVSSMLALELSGGRAAMNERTGCTL